MPLIVNLRFIAQEPLALRGELPPADFDFGLKDEMVRVNSPITYDLAAEMLDDAILVQGSLRAPLECECVRCLKRFSRVLELAITLHLPLKGEEAVPLDNDNVDLTPFLREDMLLEFPQHPLCKPDCAGLKKMGESQAPAAGEKPASEASAWAELNKLKL
jgi:uncharacterized protein